VSTVAPDSRARAAARATTLQHDSVPMRLYHEAKRLGTWDPRNIDLRADAQDWTRFSVVERDVLLRLTVLFQAAEESMTRDVLPLIMTVVREDRLEEELFLTTFLSEEARHTEFFRRVLDEVCRQSGDLQRYQTPSFRRLFAERLPAAMAALLTDPSPLAQARALVTYTLVGEGVLGEAGYHVCTTALEGRRAMPGFREGLRRAQQDEDRHMAYGLFLLSRLVGADPKVWDAVSRCMDELLPLTLGVVSEFFEPYTPMPFGLRLEDTVQYAIARFSSRWADLEEARERGSPAPTADPAGPARRVADETVRDFVAWMSRELDSTPVGMQGDTGTVYTLRVGDSSTSALLITREVLDYHSAADVIGALRTHAVPRRLRERRVRLTCLRAGGKIIVQPPHEGP
jgi:ribonucleoside-diphosphate reductase beta chain